MNGSTPGRQQSGTDGMKLGCGESTVAPLARWASGVAAAARCPADSVLVDEVAIGAMASAGANNVSQGRSADWRRYRLDGWDRTGLRRKEGE
jgi:hypothetical protein